MRSGSLGEIQDQTIQPEFRYPTKTGLIRIRTVRPTTAIFCIELFSRSFGLSPEYREWPNQNSKGLRYWLFGRTTTYGKSWAALTWVWNMVVVICIDQFWDPDWGTMSHGIEDVQVARPVWISVGKLGAMKSSPHFRRRPAEESIWWLEEIAREATPCIDMQGVVEIEYRCLYDMDFWSCRVVLFILECRIQTHLECAGDMLNRPSRDDAINDRETAIVQV